MSEQSFVIIDDDLVAADIQRRLLEKQGHKVEVSLDASNAIEFVSRIKPDILLVDIMMPNIDGLEVVRRLRLVPELRGLKIIVVSSKSYQADRDRALAMGADGMILKPVTPALRLGVGRQHGQEDGGGSQQDPQRHGPADQARRGQPIQQPPSERHSPGDPSFDDDGTRCIRDGSILEWGWGTCQPSYIY